MSYLDLAPLRGAQGSELRSWSQGKNENKLERDEGETTLLGGWLN